ncbi:PepSY-associated TM helix domain-containing protein [Hymenobacter rubripertinctus]|uniref:PepSY domain-containing protein n=1 Tax=Hymenobacter rubripertinctus TaxID=2029981 RepID=A0A418QXB2_9BACT|nr:PepSY-associated TM helix domain-containing protein [Hymenobacter rubripertinctus]RIY09803.1 PepSY domain-containing protein [Hymenobacter rubripertinctus]
MKTFFRNIHLYLSLVSGLVIAVVCLTGAGLVFEKELEQTWHPERYFVAPAATQRPLSELTTAVRAYKPGSRITGLKVYADPGRTVEFTLADVPAEVPKAGARAGRGNDQAAGSENARDGKSGEAGKAGGEGGRGPTVFVNPGTAAITGELNYRETVFFTLMAVHRGMVGGTVGKLVVGVSTVLFLFILGTGLVLWWPATRKAVKQRLNVKWSGGWKRLNHDLHIVLGFYAALFLFVFAFTGLAWSFEWFNNGIYALTNSPLERPVPPVSAAPTAAAAFTPDAALTLARQLAPAARFYSLQLPKDAAGSIRVATLRPGAAYDNATDEIYLDQYSGRLLQTQTYEQRSLGQRVRGLFKPVHTGAIFGWPSKIISLLMCLLGFTFPITGTILWLNRLKKARKKSARQLVA